jgi:putative spermidine/putrescine transport system ATP-binding protein
MTAALELHGLSKRYGAVVAVDDISLVVPEGRLVFLLGPCGKTTTLRMVAGFVPPDAGEVWIRGTRVDGLPPERRGLGMVFQHYALFPHLTVGENVAFGLRMRGVPAAERRERVERALALVQLGGFEARYPRALSGGQQQRVALARAIVVQPTLLLLDEPLSHLDLKLRTEMRSEIRALQRALGIATIFVTHDQEEAMTMADEIAVMAAGRIVQVGTPTALYERPVNRFVAGFIGEANVEAGHVTAAEGAKAWRADAGGIAVIGSGTGSWRTGAAVAIAIRPERIRLEPAAADGGTTAVNRVGGTIEECIFRGALRRYRVRLGPGRVWNVDEPAAGGQPPLAAGATVSLSWRAEDCRVIPEI